MTISTTFTFDPDMRAISRMARRLAGILGPTEEPSGPEIAMDGELLNLQLKAWQLAARMLKQTERVIVTIDATARTTGVLTVASDTIDVEFPMALKLTGGTQPYRIDRLSRQDYIIDSEKTQTGIPTKALIERGTSVSMKLVPIPTSTCESVEYTRVFLIRDAGDGYTADAWQRCGQAVVLGLALDLAEAYNKNDGKIQRLGARYAVAMDSVLGDNRERGDVKFTL